MRQKLILFAVLAVAGVVVLAAASVTVYAFGHQGEVITPGEQVEVIPIQAAPVVEPQAAPVRYEKFSGGCNHSVKMQLTQKPVEESSGDHLLTQVSQ